MESEKIWKLLGGVGVLVGIVIALTPFNLAHVCETAAEMSSGASSHMGGMPAATNVMPTIMKCNWMGVSEVFLGLLVAVNGLLILLAKSGWRSLVLMLGVLGIAVILLPTNLGIGVCKNSAMACHTTKAFLNVSGIALVIIALFGLFTRKLRNLV